MAFSSGYIVGFAAGVCVLASLGLASTSEALKEGIEANKEADLQYNILGALGFADPDNKPTVPEITELWKEHVSVRYVDGATGADADLTDLAKYDINNDGTINAADVREGWKQAARPAEKGGLDVPPLLAVYQGLEGGKSVKYAVSMFGMGLWGEISSYMAMDLNGKSVEGITFFAPAETPGLGGEITKTFYKDKWKGQSLVDDKGAPRPLIVAKGPATQPGQIDGVSGATLTGDGVTNMMRAATDYYTPFFKRLPLSE